jgi:hypothetical protein
MRVEQYPYLPHQRQFDIGFSSIQFIDAIASDPMFGGNTAAKAAGHVMDAGIDALLKPTFGAEHIEMNVPIANMAEDVESDLWEFGEQSLSCLPDQVRDAINWHGNIMLDAAPLPLLGWGELLAQRPKLSCLCL